MPRSRARRSHNVKYHSLLIRRLTISRYPAMGQ